MLLLEGDDTDLAALQAFLARHEDLGTAWNACGDPRDLVALAHDRFAPRAVLGALLAAYEDARRSAEPVPHELLLPRAAQAVGRFLGGVPGGMTADLTSLAAEIEAHLRSEDWPTMRDLLRAASFLLDVARRIEAGEGRSTTRTMMSAVECILWTDAEFAWNYESAEWPAVLERASCRLSDMLRGRLGSPGSPGSPANSTSLS